MSDTREDRPAVLRVPANTDREGEFRGLGVSVITFKVTAADSNGLLVLENRFQQKGGPARHLHYEQDEWFYCVEGEFLIEIGQQWMTLTPGDSVLGPRKIPHVWACVGDGAGKILIAFTPAGRMEAFFREVTKTNAMPASDPALWRAHGMELLGPPLAVAD